MKKLIGLIMVMIPFLAIARYLYEQGGICQVFETFAGGALIAALVIGGAHLLLSK